MRTLLGALIVLFVASCSVSVETRLTPSGSSEKASKFCYRGVPCVAPADG